MPRRDGIATFAAVLDFVHRLADNLAGERHLGTRHRAALGITVGTDAVAVVVSEETNKTIATRSLETTVAEPCHPVRIAHGHIDDCLEKQTDFIFVPNQINAEVTDVPTVQSHLCPWGG